MRIQIPPEIREIYKQRQRESQLLRERRRQDWIENNPELADLQRAKRNLGAALALAHLQDRPDEAEQIADELANVAAEMEQIFAEYEAEMSSEVGFYRCKKCQDTGIYQGELCSCALTIRHTMEEQKGIAFPPPTGIYLDDLRTELFSREISADYYHGKASPATVAENFHKKAIALVENFPKSGGNYYFFGKPGTGKTWLASAIANELRRAGYGVVFLRSRDFVDLTAKHRILERSFRPDPEEKQVTRDRFNFVREADVLILDDLGSEQNNDEAYNDLIGLFEKRSEGQNSAKRLTIVTGNLAPTEFSRRYDERMGSRLMGNFMLIPFEGPDLRLSISMREI